MKTKERTKIGYLDGYRFQSAILAGCNCIIDHEKELNELNVFPIPDKDTGSNLKRTLKPLVSGYPVPEPKISPVGQEMAGLAVRSALGYSGIIFSQMILGFAEGLKNHQKISPGDLKTIVPIVQEKAYQSVEHPMEGTILSVLREWSREISRTSSRSNDFVVIMERSYQKAVSALAKTPDQLEVLKKNKVVDAGGKAFVYFLRGILDFIKKGKLARYSSARIYPHKKSILESRHASLCVECCVQAHHLNRKGLIKKLQEIGQDLIFYSAPDFAKFHINTQYPEQVLRCASAFGKISSDKIFTFSPDLKENEKQDFCLVADTTCDLTEDVIEKSQVYFVPIKVQIDDDIYTDRWDLIPEEFYRFMATSAMPKTSQPSLNAFARIYGHLLMHYRSIISIHLSKALSGTFQTAAQASQGTAPERISVIDGKNVSVGLGLVVMEGLRALEKRKTHEETVLQIENATKNTEIFIGLPTLRYLIRGGRITKMKGIIATILNINPILSINPGGKLVPVSKARGRKNLEKKIFRLVGQKRQKMSGELSIAVAHTNAPEIGNRILQRIKQDFSPETVLMMNASPALGAHAGPGAYGIAIHHHSISSSDNNRNT